MLLAGDIGGTKTALGDFSKEQGRTRHSRNRRSTARTMRA